MPKYEVTAEVDLEDFLRDEVDTDDLAETITAAYDNEDCVQIAARLYGRLDAEEKLRMIAKIAAE